MRNYNGLHQVLSGSCSLCFLLMSGSLIAASDPLTSTLERSAIEDKYKWDLSKMYASQEDWEAHYKKVEGMIGDFAGKMGHVGESATTLLDALTARDQINIQIEKLGGFASLRRDEDMRVSANQGFFQ